MTGSAACSSLLRLQEKHSPDLMKELRNAAVRVGDEAKCGIIFGHGDNFCAGLDLAWAAENWKEDRAQRLPFQFNLNS